MKCMQSFLAILCSVVLNLLINTVQLIILVCVNVSIQKFSLSLEMGSWIACSCSIAQHAQACPHALTIVPASLAGTAIEAAARQLLAISQRTHLSSSSAAAAAPGPADTALTQPSPSRSLVRSIPSCPFCAEAPFCILLLVASLLGTSTLQTNIIRVNCCLHFISLDQT